MRVAVLFTVLLLSASVLSGCTSDAPKRGSVTLRSTTAATAASSAASGDVTPPSITDFVVSEVGQTVATVTWTISDGHYVVSSHAEYRSIGSNLSASTPTVYGTGIRSAPITDLRPAAEYEVAVVGTDGAGNTAWTEWKPVVTVASSDVTLPTITGVAVRTVADSTAILGWHAGDDQGSVQSWIEYGTSEAYGSTTSRVSTSGWINETLSGLNPSTLYHARIRAVDAANNPAFGDDVTFLTLSGADSTPPAVSGLTAVGITSRSATISWAVEDASKTSTNVLEWGTNPQLGESASAEAGTGSKAVPLTGLSPSTTYYYRARATDSAGNAATSETKSFATTDPPETDEPVITGVSHTSVTSGGAIIRWTVDDDSGSLTSRVLYGIADATTEMSALNGPGVKQFALTDLQPETVYKYRIKAVDGNGNTKISQLYTFTTLTKFVVTGVTTSALSPYSVTVRWNVEIGTGGPPTSHVRFSRPGQTPQSGPDLDGVGQQTHQLTGLMPASTYNFFVRADDGAGRTVDSPTLAFTTLAAPGSVHVESDAFDDGTPIPIKFAWTGDPSCPSGAENRSPPLRISWNRPPEAPVASRMVLIVEDLSSPPPPYVHWIFWNAAFVGPTVSLPEAANVEAMGASVGANDYPIMRFQWGGPCPTDGLKHNYFFYVYLVDGLLDLGTTANKDQVRAAIVGHTIAVGDLLGTFQM